MLFGDLVPWNRKKDSLVTQAGEAPIYALQKEVNRLFDEFWNSFDLTPFRSIEHLAGARMPKVDITETDDEIIVSAELPGLDEKNIEVLLSRDTLTIKGEKKEEIEDKKKNYRHVERSYGAFQRTIALPSEIETEKVSATFKKGVLVVTLPKTMEAKKEVKKIAVKTD